MPSTPASRAATTRPRSRTITAWSNDTYPVLKLVNGEIKRVDEPALTALNMRLRDDYTPGLRQGPVALEQDHLDGRLRLQAGAAATSRSIARSANSGTSTPRPDGVLIDDATWNKRKGDWLPSTDDGDFIASLMQPVTEAGGYAPWISPPKVGIDNKPGDFEYVKIET